MKPFDKQCGLRVQTPQPRLVSCGYVMNSDRKIFVRIFQDPLNGIYLCKVKMPKHATLHLMWDAANWRFQGDWLCFSVEMGPWLCVEQKIHDTLNYMMFD